MASDCTIGVVVGLAAEARIARRLGWKVAIGGGTPRGAEAAAQRLIAEGAGGLVSFGLAGGLDPQLRPGSLIVPSVVVACGIRYVADAELMHRLGGATAHVLLGADTVVASATRKRCLRNATAAAAVDLESGAVARVAAAHAKPFAALRAICDPAERALPSAALAALDASGGIGAWRVLTELARHPRQIRALLALAADAAAARRALVSRVRQLTRQSSFSSAA